MDSSVYTLYIIRYFIRVSLLLLDEDRLLQRKKSCNKRTFFSDSGMVEENIIGDVAATMRGNM